MVSARDGIAAAPDEIRRMAPPAPRLRQWPVLVLEKAFEVPSFSRPDSQKHAGLSVRINKESVQSQQVFREVPSGNPARSELVTGKVLCLAPSGDEQQHEQDSGPEHRPPPFLAERSEAGMTPCRAETARLMVV